MDEEKKRERQLAKYAYHNAHFRKKTIPFSVTSPEDLEMLKWLDEQPRISVYVKGLIWADMERRKKEKEEE